MTHICKPTFPKDQLGGRLLLSRKTRRTGYELPFPAHFPEQAALWKRPSARSALFDSLLVSAGAFEKDRQKYRQFICYHRLLDALLIPFVFQ
jgi:hypothetical protein